jgi:hypothetical protein
VHTSCCLGNVLSRTYKVGDKSLCFSVQIRLKRTMSNIIYLVHKKRFDYSFGMYLRKFHHVTFMTSDPMVGLFLDTQHAAPEYLYKVEPVQLKKRKDPSIQQILEQTTAYMLSTDVQVKEALYALCVGYVQFLRKYLVNTKISIIITTARQFLDIFCITAVANELNLPVCYLSSGFFRGASCGLSFEPPKPDNPEVWGKRQRTEEDRPVIPVRSVPEVTFDLVSIKKTNPLLTLWQNARYQRNPFWQSRHPDLTPADSLFNHLKKQLLQAVEHDLPDQSSTALPEEFVFLPLQGNGVFERMGYPMGLSGMEQLITYVALGLQEANKYRVSTLKLVVKEHPAEPGIISTEYKRQHPNILFLCKYPIGELLDKANLVVTFNSLAGFEALQRYKPVITFAPFFYTLPQLVYCCDDLDSLSILINDALDKGCDQQAVDAFVLFVKTHFEVPCLGFNRSNPTIEMFRKIHGRIEGLLDYAQSYDVYPASWASHGGDCS